MTKNPHPDAMLEVHLLTEANGGVPDKYAGGDALNGQLELVVGRRLVRVRLEVRGRVRVRVSAPSPRAG